RSRRTHPRAGRGRSPADPRRPDRLRVRPYRDSVRHRSPGGGRRARRRRRSAADRIVEHVAGIHLDARGPGERGDTGRRPQLEAFELQMDAVIIGAGIAGLSAAYELTRRGVGFIVLERAPRAGGVILSEAIDGYTVDAGPDSLLVQKPEGIKLCEEIGLADRLMPTKPPRL